MSGYSSDYSEDDILLNDPTIPITDNIIENNDSSFDLNEYDNNSNGYNEDNEEIRFPPLQNKNIREKEKEFTFDDSESDGYGEDNEEISLSPLQNKNIQENIQENEKEFTFNDSESDGYGEDNEEQVFLPNNSNIEQNIIEINDNDNKIDDYSSSSSTDSIIDEPDEINNKKDKNKLKLTLKKEEYTELKDWNKEFQNILLQQDSREKYQLLQQIGHDFVYAAKTYGKIIISEIHLPENKKTIKSINVGGIAGGEKYICQSIFFKLVTDSIISEENEPICWMYGGSQRNDTAAIKAAGQELQGLISFYNIADYEDIHFPLMALIDYRGYRLIALSILPVDRQSIIYGSADGGHTCFSKDPKFNKTMLNLGKQLNLKPHLVCDKVMAICGDIEGHKGEDGKYYMLDFARTFPPEAPPKNSEPGGPRVVFFEHLRPEFVKGYRIPLSSDAFTKWGKSDPNSANHNGRVRQATEYLYNTTIPEYAKNLDSIASSVINQHSWSITQDLHRHGINVRHCGRVRNNCTSNDAKKLLMSEMLARILKELINLRLRATMLESKIPLKMPYRTTVVNFINEYIMAWQNPELTSFWTKTAKDILLKKFPFSIKRRELGERFDLRTNIIPSVLFRRFQELTATTISTQILYELEYISSLFEIEFLLIPSDIISVGAKVKHLNVIDEAEAKMLIYDATTSFGTRATQLWEMIDNKFEAALSSNTASYRTLIDWASALLKQARQQIDNVRSVEILNLATDKAETALKIAPEYVEGLYIYTEIKLEEAVRTEDGTSLQDEIISNVVRSYSKLVNKKSDYHFTILSNARKTFKEMTSQQNNRHLLKRIKLLSCAIQYRALLVDAQTSKLPLLLREYTLAMYEYIIATSKENGYSSHLEASILATGQALQSHFMRSKSISLDDEAATYSIDMKRSNLDKNQYKVLIKRDGKNLPPVDLEYPDITPLSFWIYKINTTEFDNISTLYEQFYNLLGSNRIPFSIENKPLTVLLKYEPVDAFILHEIQVDWEDVPRQAIPKIVNFYIIKHLSKHPTLFKDIDNNTLKPNYTVEPKSNSEAVLHCIQLSKPIQGSYIAIKFTPSSYITECCLQSIKFKGKHVLKTTMGRAQLKSSICKINLELKQSRRIKNSDSAELPNNILSKAFRHQGYYLATLIKMASVSPILKALTSVHLKYAKKKSSSKNSLGGGITFIQPLRNNSLVFNAHKNYSTINISHCGAVSDDVVEGVTTSTLLSLNLEYNISITNRCIVHVATIAGLNLRKINLQGCEQLTTISIASIAKHCTSLLELSMWSTAESDAFPFICKLKNLQKLSVRECVNLQPKILRNILINCSKLEDLDLSFCNVSDKDCKRLSSCNLTRLVLDYCKITDKGISYFIYLPRIQNISLVGDSSLVQFILQHTYKIEYINLTGCGSLTNSLTTTISHYCTNIKELYLGGISNLDDSSLVYIGLSCIQLLVLDISGTQVSHNSISIICKYCELLEDFYLNDCKNITNDDLSIIQKLQNLKVLSLQENHRITQYGILQLILNIKSLQAIDLLECSKISDISVMKAKQINPSLNIAFNL